HRLAWVARGPRATPPHGGHPGGLRSGLDRLEHEGHARREQGEGERRRLDRRLARLHGTERQQGALDGRRARQHLRGRHLRRLVVHQQGVPLRPHLPGGRSARSGQEADGAAGREPRPPGRRARPALAQPPARRRQTAAGVGRRRRIETPASEVHRTPRRIARRVLLVVGLYLVFAYLVLPAFWRHYEHLPAMATMPTGPRAPTGLPGDPLNVALVGTEAEVVRAFAAAGWHPADAITLRSSVGIAESVVFARPDPDAPVSPLLLFDRRQDLAFERDVGRSARERNHVRLWRTDLRAHGDRAVWIGAATFDRGVGLSHTTGQITHHIAPDIDVE